MKWMIHFDRGVIKQTEYHHQSSCEGYKMIIMIESSRGRMVCEEESLNSSEGQIEGNDAKRGAISLCLCELTVKQTKSRKSQQCTSSQARSTAEQPVQSKESEYYYGHTFCGFLFAVLRAENEIQHVCTYR